MILKRILKKTKKFIISIKNRIKLKEKVLNSIYRKFDKKLIKEMNDNNIVDVKQFKTKNWHFGYRYYIGEYDTKKVFIKVNTKKSLIKHEYDINEYINENSSILASMIPNVYLYKERKKYSYIVEEYLDGLTISKACKNIKNKVEIYNQFIEIIKELQKIHLLHIDINDENVYIDKNGKVIITDFGYSLINDNIDMSFIGNRRLVKKIYMSINPKTRMGEGYIDDAYSFMVIAKMLDKEFVSSNYESWKELNKYIDKMPFDYMVIKDEIK